MKIKIMNLIDHKPSKPYDFLINRQSPIGNTFHMASEKDRKRVIKYFKRYFKDLLKNPKKEANKPVIAYLNKIESKLKKHGQVRLFCHCAPMPCHGDVIKKHLKGIS